MGCNCLNEKKADLSYIERLAVAFSISEQVDVKIYTYYLTGIGDVYDFEPTFEKTQRQVVKTIQFRDYQSEEVLQDVRNSGLDDDAEVEKPTKVVRKPRKHTSIKK